MDKIIILLLLLLGGALTAQVGIGTVNPQSTLDIRAIHPTGTATEIDGIIIPVVSRQRMLSMINIPTGNMVYCNDVSGIASIGATTSYVIQEGFYYFNGAVWMRIGGLIYTGSNSITVNGVSLERAALTGDLTAEANSNLTIINPNVINSEKILDGSVANEDLVPMPALSIKGNAINSVAAPGDLSADTDGQVLRRSGSSLGFGTVSTEGISDGAITTSKIANNSVTTAKLPPGASSTTFLRGDNSWALPAGLLPSGSNNQTLRHNGTSWIANDFLWNTGTRIGLGTTLPSFILSFSGQNSTTIGVERRPTNAAGSFLSIEAGGAFTSGTNLNGGNLFLNSGISTGSGTSSIVFSTASGGVTGNTDNSPTEKMRIIGNGNVGIGIPNPTTRLHVNGGGRFSDNVMATGFGTSSDKRWKKEIAPISNALETILSLTSYSYFFKNQTELENEHLPISYNFNSKKQFGFIAQELEEVLPELVTTDEMGFKSVEYQKIIPLLVEAIKQQQVLIEQLLQKE